MFAWLARLFGREEVAFGRCKNHLFRYWNGQRYVNGDPMRIVRELTADPATTLELDMKDADAPIPQAQAAFGRVVAAARRAFRVKEAEEGGLDDPNCKELLNQFIFWLVAQKKNTPPSRTFAPVSPEPLADASPPENSSASTSTGEGSRPDLPLPSPVELASRSERPATGSMT